MNNEGKILSMLENLTTVVVQIQSEQVKINQRLDNLEQGQAKLEQGQTKLEQGQAKLEQSFVELKQNFVELKHNYVELASLTNGIIQHQNEDYALLQVVDRRLEHLANVSQIHEEKFQKLRAL